MRCRDAVKAESHRVKLKDAVDQLQQYPQYRYAAWHVMEYFDCVDDFKSLLDVAKALPFDDTVLVEYAAAYIYARLDDPQGALARIDSLKLPPKKPQPMHRAEHPSWRNFPIGVLSC